MKQCIMGLLSLVFGLVAVSLAVAYTFTRSGEMLCLFFMALAVYSGYEAMKNGN